MPRTRRTTGRRYAKHPEGVIYSVWVLWLIGFSEMQIAQQVRLRKGQVSGLVNQSGYRNRKAMGDDKRQEAYVDLLSKRYDEQGNPIDEGRLRNLPDTVMKLRR